MTLYEKGETWMIRYKCEEFDSSIILIYITVNISLDHRWKMIGEGGGGGRSQIRIYLFF